MKTSIEDLLLIYQQQCADCVTSYHDNAHDDSGEIHSDSGYHADAHDNNPNGYMI